MRPFKNYVTCTMAFLPPFNSVTLCQFYSICQFNFTLCYSLKFIEKSQNERKEDFLLHVTSKEVKNWICRNKWIFRHTCMYKQTTLCQYDIVISDRLAGYFLDVLSFLLTVISSEHHEKPRRKDWVTEKMCIEEFV